MRVRAWPPWSSWSGRCRPTHANTAERRCPAGRLRPSARGPWRIAEARTRQEAALRHECGLQRVHVLFTVPPERPRAAAGTACKRPGARHALFRALVPITGRQELRRWVSMRPSVRPGSRYRASCALSARRFHAPCCAPARCRRQDRSTPPAWAACQTTSKRASGTDGLVPSARQITAHSCHALSTAGGTGVMHRGVPRGRAWRRRAAHLGCRLQLNHVYLQKYRFPCALLRISVVDPDQACS